MNGKILALLAAPLFVSLNGAASAQAWPAKPVRVIIGLPPGTVVDIAMRQLGKKLEPRLGQPIVIETRVGANNTIAANAVVKADPDGYTYWVGTAMTVNPLFLKANAVVAARDLAPVANVLTVPYLLYSSAKLPVKSFAELVAWSKANPPNKLNFASQIPQYTVLMKLIGERTGITFTAIPYKGGGPAAIASMLAGDTDLTIGAIAGYPPHLTAGTLRALMITAPNRSALLPNVPTSGELGIKNIEAASNIGLWAPRGTPPAMIRKLNSETLAVLKEADTIDVFRKAGAEPLGTTPEDQAKLFESETKLWSEAVKLANYQPE